MNHSTSNNSAGNSNNIMISNNPSEQKPEKFQEEVWYIIINNESRGPLSLRDLDVLLRTSEINSSTYAWKNGMKEWKLMH